MASNNVQAASEDESEGTSKTTTGANQDVQSQSPLTTGKKQGAQSGPGGTRDQRADEDPSSRSRSGSGSQIVPSSHDQPFWLPAANPQETAVDDVTGCVSLNPWAGRSPKAKGNPPPVKAGDDGAEDRNKKPQPHRNSDSDGSDSDSGSDSGDDMDLLQAAPPQTEQAQMSASAPDLLPVLDKFIVSPNSPYTPKTPFKPGGC